MIRKHIFPILCTIWAIVLWTGCDESAQVDNPYDNQISENADGVVGIDDKSIDPTTIQGLHKLIFKPTCANSGCHDGLFEPDFRTIESSYNSLVNQPIIKNDEVDPLPARVVPGDHARSMIIRRLETDLNNNSGIMPLSVDPGSDWSTRKAEYIGYLKAWIDAGAKDLNGNSRQALDYPPRLEGMLVASGSTVYPRSGRFSPVQVPKSAGTVDVWFAYSDLESGPEAFSGLQFNHSIHYMEFDSLNWMPMQYVGTPKNAVGLNQVDVPHYFRFSLNLNSYQSGDVIWLRTRISDGTNKVELPNGNSLFNHRQYCTIRLL
ncbi:MAG: hypothetical protein H6606_00690 [Flavobacteriales bacterium]|nr:hypothetical protein [Flavobacteriales bacterium]